MLSLINGIYSKIRSDAAGNNSVKFVLPGQRAVSNKVWQSLGFFVVMPAVGFGLVKAFMQIKEQKESQAKPVVMDYYRRHREKGTVPAKSHRKNEIKTIEDNAEIGAFFYW
ncbi:uncharacterized protein LOC108597124 [Drosophila busckii]|uniref:uncharacterized protein LOC108597124 n=1 Tax=Drosophila busckii TaxID=30019 RepID=UPI00083F273A|nr:uncharacterized protein LOC108597124 [Drosophila busckii]